MANLFTSFTCFCCSF